MKLYGYWRSTSSWRVRIALNLKGLAHTYEAIPLLEGKQHSAEYKQKNPVGTVPLLELELGGKVHRIAQSMAIIEYLDEVYPEPRLLPKEPLLRARVRTIAETVNSGIQPLQNLAVMQKVANELNADDKKWSQDWNLRGLTSLEALVAEEGGRYSVGDQLTLADLYVVPQLYSARRFKVDVSGFPNLLRVEKACEVLPAFQKAHPDAQPDAVKS